MIIPIKPELTGFPSAPGEPPPVTELHITITYSDPADERPWFAECQELPLTGEGNTPWQALGMLQEMGELYFQSLYETGGWERVIGQLKT